MTTKTQVTGLYHYPVKGLSAQRLDRVHLEPGQGFPLDRVFGLARQNSGFDPDNPKPLPKSRFVMLARDGELALLNTRYDRTTAVLSITSQGEKLEFDLSDPDQAQAAASHVAEALGYPPERHPILAQAGAHRFTDVSVVSAQMMNAISLINEDSVTHFGNIIGETVQPDRFRANLYFSGLSPFSELEMVGETIEIGDVALKILKRTQRCPATEVNTATGQRDINVPGLLQRFMGHMDMGIYAEVIRGGQIAEGDAIRV